MSRWDKAEDLEEEIGRRYVGNLTVYLIFVAIFLGWSFTSSNYMPAIIISIVAGAFALIDYILRREVDEFLEGALLAYFLVAILGLHYHFILGRNIPIDSGLFYIVAMAMIQNFAYWFKIPEKLNRKFSSEDE